MNNNEFLNKKREKEINNDNKYTTEIKKQQNEEKENKIDIKNIIDKAFDNFISGNNNEFLKNYDILINNLNSSNNKIIKK